MKDYAIGDISIHIECGAGLETIKYGFESNEVKTYDEFMNIVCEDYFTDEEKAEKRIKHLLKYLIDTKYLDLNKYIK